MTDSEYVKEIIYIYILWFYIYIYIYMGWGGGPGYSRYVQVLISPWWYRYSWADIDRYIGVRWWQISDIDRCIVFRRWRRLCAMYLHICNTAVCLIVIDDGVFKSCQKLGGRGGGLGFPSLYRLRGGVSLDGRYNYPSYVIYSPFFPGGGGGECTPPYLHRLISNQACMADPLKKQIDILYVDNQYYPLC